MARSLTELKQSGHMHDYKVMLFNMLLTFPWEPEESHMHGQ